jgi:hypothetical protein
VANERPKNLMVLRAHMGASWRISVFGGFSDIIDEVKDETHLPRQTIVVMSILRACSSSTNKHRDLANGGT